MGELRAYALGITELRAVVGATGAQADHVRTLARAAFAAPPLGVRDLIGPLYRRVPGAPVLRADDPTPADLDLLLAGHPVPPARAAAVWRLLEAVVAGLAWSSIRVPDVDVPVGLLAPTGLSVPPIDGLSVGWCARSRAARVPGLSDWLAGSEDWARAAEGVGRPPPDVVVFRAR